MQIDLSRCRVRWTALVAVVALFGALAQIQLAAAEDNDPQPPELSRGDRNQQALQFLARNPAMLVAETGKYWIGVECREAPPELMSQLGLKEGEGLVVVHVAEDSAAAKAGLKLHDLILSTGDAKLNHPPDLIKAVNAADGKEISLKIMRGGKEQTVAVTPAERSQENLRVIARPGMGMMFPGGGPPPKIPDNVTISIMRQGNKPAKITVSRGDEKWEVTDDDFGKLPEELRPIVKGMLGGGPMTIHMQGGPNMPPGIRMEGMGVGGGGFGGGMSPETRIEGGWPGQNAMHVEFGLQGLGAGPIRPPQGGYSPPGVPQGSSGSGGPRGLDGLVGQGSPDLMQRLDQLDHRLQQLQDEIRGLRDGAGPDRMPRMGPPPQAGQRQGPPPDGEHRGPPPPDGDRRGPPPGDQ